MNRFVYLALTLCISLFSCYAYVQLASTLILDPAYVESLQLPSDGDSMIIPYIGTFLFGTAQAFAHVFFHSLFLLACFSRLTQKKISFLAIIIQKDGWITVSIRLVGYILIATLTLLFVLDTPLYRWYEWQWYISTVLTLAAYIIWFVMIFRKSGERIYE